MLPRQPFVCYLVLTCTTDIGSRNDFPLCLGMKPEWIKADLDFLVIPMKTKILMTCDTCPHELILGVACDWQPGNCRHHMETSSKSLIESHKHSAWAVNVADESEYDAVKSFG